MPHSFLPNVAPATVAQSTPYGDRHSRRSRSRRRSRRGGHHGRDPSQSGPEDSRLPATALLPAAETLQGIDTHTFRKWWLLLPKHLKDVAFEAPPDVVVDIDSIRDPTERISMCIRLNELRRDRIRKLAPPRLQPFYDEDGIKIVPMSRSTERHFWETFHKVPLSTTDMARWKIVSRWLDDCPEKPPPRKDFARAVHFASADLPAIAPPEMPRQPATGGLSSSPLGALRRLADEGPLTPRQTSKPRPGDGAPEGLKGGDACENDFLTWVEQRARAATTDLSLSSLTLDKRHRFTKKTTAASALKSLPPLPAMSEAYALVYAAFLGRLQRLLKGLNPRSADSRALQATCAALNIQFGKCDPELPLLLARLKALELMDSPPQ